jgi:peptide/nickel transport system substrate-binding protein
MNCARPPFDDVRVRVAVNHAIDWDAILTAIYLGSATRLATAFLPSGFGYDAELAPYSYDPNKARALLAEAGYGGR